MERGSYLRNLCRDAEHNGHLFRSEEETPSLDGEVFYR